MTHAPDRLLVVLAVGVLVVGAIGFAIEIDPDRYLLRGFVDPQARSGPGSADDDGDALPARSYSELAVRPWGSGAQASWDVDGEDLRRAYRAAPAPPEAEHPATPAALADRARLRAYEGAPPVIPHPVASSGAAECLACHESGAALGRLRARPIPHEAYASCTQCHVTARSGPPLPDTQAAQDSAAERPGLAATGPAPLRPAAFGPRAWPGAPPAIPHTTLMRDDCLACHGPGGREGMRSSHPERQECRQCHAPSATLDQRALVTPGAGPVP